jgi:hypothetical protein
MLAMTALMKQSGYRGRRMLQQLPLVSARRLLHTDFEVSTKLKDEFFTRRFPGRVVGGLPIVFQSKKD